MFSLKNWRRKRAVGKARISAAQWRRVEAQLPFLANLAADGRARLREMAVQFLAEKELHGAHGLWLSEDARLSIALQACLPILDLGLDYYRGWVGIVVYPGEFVVPRSMMDEAGVVHEFDDVLSGEAWEGGPVILSWPQERDTASGINVVIHEFAHKLDMLNGVADGMPPLHREMSRKAWADAFTAAYQDFCARIDRGASLPLDPYAADHPAEFFAVASEAFFIDPHGLRAAYPEVYRQLALFYRQNPA